MSKNKSERSEMTPEADVAFMVDACNEIADARSRGASMQQRVDAVMKALRVSENRAYEFLRGIARRVDGFEKDRAREIKAQIEAEDARQKEQEHIEWLRSTYQHLLAQGEGMDSREVVQLGDLLRKLGAFDSALEVPATPEK